MRALVLSGGEGSRLRPITHTNAKQLIPVANKPILFYGLEALAAAGIRDVGMIVGDTEQEIRAAVRDGSDWGLSVQYIRQEAPLGLAHAVLVAQEYLGEEEFVMYLGDNLVREDVGRFVKAFEEHRPDAQIFLVKTPEPERFGVAVLEGDRVTRLVEKPREHISDLALSGIYIFNSAIFQAAASISPSWRGELEITDAIQYLLDHGYTVRAEQITGWWKDTGRVEDLLEANRIMLEDQARRIDGVVDEASHIVGPVVVEDGAEVTDSVIRGPAVIGRHATVIRSTLGPHVSVFDDSRIEDSEISDSIIMGGTMISEVRRMTGSLVGTNVRICKDDQHPTTFQFVIGDSSQVRIP
ncbi:MAG TPA: glucose-1-phosphate thymidylyltransferase [Actinomycetota bacterium]